MKKIHIFIVFFLFIFLSCAHEEEDGQWAEAFTVEDIRLPEGLTAEVAALDVLPDGRLIAAFMRGEIMIYDADTKKWELFATGLHEPLGMLAISNNEILVMQLPELTRIKDTNGDGLADQYETVYDGFGMTGNYHEFTYGPVRDSQGNLYVALNAASSGGGISSEVRGEINKEGKGTQKGMFSVVPYRGWVMKITKEDRVIPFASGFRSPNGLVIGEKDRLYVTDNQGDWIASSPLYHVMEGRFYGQPASLVWTEGWKDGNPFDLSLDTLDKMREKPAVIFPHDVIANSPTQPVLIKNNKLLKDFEGQYIVGEMNQERLVRILLEEVNGVVQGAVTPFIDQHGLRKGNNRLVFAPDGSLWVGQTDHGWLGDRGIQRVNFSDKLFDVKKMQLTENGFALSFTKTLNIQDQEDLLSALSIKKYNYHYHAKYGSEQINVEKIKVKNMDIQRNKKELVLDLGSVEKGFVYELHIDSVYSKNRVDTLADKTIAYTVKEKK